MIRTFQAQPKSLSKRRPKRPLWLEALLVSSIIMLTSPFNSVLVNFMLFHPSKAECIDQRVKDLISSRYSVRWSEERFKSINGKVLHGWYLKRKGEGKTILISHGNAGNISDRIFMLSTLVHLGCSVFIYDYQGFGKSEGEPSASGIIEDGLCAYDFLTKTKGVKSDKLILYGESLGCAVSTNIMRQRQVDAVILQSPFSSIQEAARDRLPWMHLFPDWTFPQRELDNRLALKQKHAPLLLIHGEKDWILPARYSKSLYQMACEPKKLVILPNCQHNDVFVNDLALSLENIKFFLASLN